MPDFGDLIGLLLFVVFIVVAIARKFTEQKDVNERQQQRRSQKPQDLPEATRRMLYGDDVPTAQPRSSQSGGGTRTVPPRREPNVQTAQPRQGQARQPVPPPVAPRPSTTRTLTASPVRPAPPARRAPAPQRERRVQVEQFRPHEQQRREAPPMRQAPQAQRTVRRDVPPPVIPAPQPRRRAPRQKPIPQAPKAPATLRRATVESRFFDDRAELRRAIILREILGPPKAFEGLE